MVRDIERHDFTVNCVECVAGLRGQGGVHHSDTCRKRLTNVIGQGDGSHRAKRARKRELAFHEHASTCFVLDAKRKVRTKDLHDSSMKINVDEQAETCPALSGQSSASSSRSVVGARSTIAREEPVGDKRAAEYPP